MFSTLLAPNSASSRMYWSYCRTSQPSYGVRMLPVSELMPADRIARRRRHVEIAGEPRRGRAPAQRAQQLADAEERPRGSAPRIQMTGLPSRVTDTR